MKRTLLISAQLLTVVTLIWLLYPNQMLETKGGIIKIKELEKSQKEEYGNSPKILKIDVLTDAHQVNFLNQKRNLNEFIEPANTSKDPAIINLGLDSSHQKNYGELLGEKSSFEPLLYLEAYGPLNIKIEGSKSFEKIEFSIPENFQNPAGAVSIEIYPAYKPNFFKDTKGSLTEEISIFSQKSRGPWMKVDSITINWSGDRDLFLSHENLIDLAALTGSKSIQSPQIEPKAWLEGMGSKIKSLDLRYETELAYEEGKNQGWQKVRTLQEMISANSANCIDLSVYVSKLALDSGYNAYIIANTGHAFCAISMPDEGAKDALTFETTDFLRSPLKPPENPGDSPREYLPGEKIIYPERPAPRAEEKTEIYLIDLNFWSKFYQ